jgi:hypothetical protein
MRRRASIAAAALAALLLAGCGSVKIGRINADPSRYRNRTVSVTGKVTTAVGVLGTGGYQIEDGTGRIYVVSKSGVPSRGSEVTVTGTVSGGVNVLGTSLGTAIVEKHHKVKGY